MNSQQIRRTERLIALFIVGICDSIKAGVMLIEESENLLFSPHSIRRFEQVGLSPRIIDVIHAGTELDAVNRIVSPEQLIVSLDKMIAEARGFLRETEASDPQLEKWIDQIFET